MRRSLPALALIPGMLIAATPPAATPVPPGLFALADPNLEITIWAHSPMFFNPTNIDIDAKGRIWVAEGVNYRKHFDRRPDGDRIMVLTDTDGDGTADESHVFVQEPFLRCPLGVAVIGNKVVVSMAPDLVVFTDVDGDAVFDSTKGDTREVLLTGFNGRNHDHSLHSVTVGPDGKWYFSAGNCGGVFTDRSGKTFRIGASSQDSSWWPKDPERPDRDPKSYGGQKSDDGRVYVGGFIARMNPDGTDVEILAHNLRNSYENCVTSFGDIFANDNDDQPACRTFWVLEGANYGFASADGTRSWQADRRPGQDIKTATWHQQDPGVAPAGDVYGGGAPTGIVFYENGALGPPWEGTLLSCESARNTVFGYKPQPAGAGWKLERFDFLTTNKEGKVIGTDYTGGDITAKADDTKTLFRPSDIAVGPDGAVYIADWFDARVGGHNDLDESLGGTIYRVAPKGFKPKVPAFDLATLDGAIEALKSPAVHVRAIGAAVLAKWIRSGSPASAAGGLDTLLRDLGDTGPLKAYQGLTDAKNSFVRVRAAAGVVGLMSRGRPLDRNFDVAALDPDDRGALEAWGLACVGKESATFDALIANAPDPIAWSKKLAALAWRLHPPQSVPAFKARAMASALPEAARKEALTAIGFNTTAEAAQAMLDVAIATKDGSPGGAGATSAPLSDQRVIFDTALWWLLNRKDSVWKAHNLAAALRESGLYDPDTIQLTAVSLPEPPPSAFSLDDALTLTGDAKRGELASQRCLMCHRLGVAGVDFGPDLTSWGRTQSIEVILRSLIDPSADIAHGFHGTQVETTDGLIIQGLVVNEADPLIIQCMGGQTQTVPKARIKAKSPMARSLMLTATQQGLTAQDAADVAAFLKK